MADLKKAVAENVPGPFFVDTTCIDCDTCRQLAPDIFDDAGDYSFVHAQPVSDAQLREAYQALLSCPTGSIGVHDSAGTSQAKHYINDFPLPITANVYYCGFNSPKSYGGSSYLITRPNGNWLVDSPKFLPHLVKKLEALGGIDRIFLTHSDDVGDAAQFARHFHAKRIIHREELWAQPEAEIVIEGYDPVALDAEFLAIPTPGHTRGHCVLLYDNRILFSGDHMSWDRSTQGLEMPNYYLWDLNEMIRSTEKLLAYDFEWVLPGHGQRIHRTPQELKASLKTHCLHRQGQLTP